MLLELLPHVTRLLPMADKYLSTRSASERTQEAALAAMAANVRGDLGQVIDAHAGIQRALKDQAEQIAEIAVEGTRTRMGVESIEARVAGLEKMLRLTMKLTLVALVLVAGCVVLLGFMLVHGLGR